MPRQKVAHKQLQKEGLWIANEFYPFSILWRKLRQTREEQGENLEDAAKKLGITPSALSRLERSQSTPGSDILGRIIGYIFGEAQVTFGTQRRKPNKQKSADTLSQLRHTLNTDPDLSNAQRSRLLKLYSLLYEEFTATPK